MLDDRNTIIESTSGQPWCSFDLQDPRAHHPVEDTAFLTYGVAARREGDPDYSALMSSMYVRRDDGWKLAFHQQTPR